MLTESKKEDRSNRICPRDIKANPVVLDSNNMLDPSDDMYDDEVEFEKRKLYELYYHDELYGEYNSNPTPKKVYVHNLDLAPITLLVCDTI